jgi:hypothetical protein
MYGTAFLRTVFKERRGKKVRAAVSIFLTILMTGSANASIVFSGFGYNQEAGAIASGSAGFSISGDVLTLVLTNTTAGRTTAQGNALTGVTFDIKGPSGALTLTSFGLTDTTDKFWTSKTASNVVNSLAGSWTSKLGSNPLGEYGVATTGFNGRFKGGSISLGKASPDYGIVSDGTFDGSNLPFGGAKYPFVQNSLTFSFSGASGLNESKITNVILLFGTSGTGIVSAIPEVPPPASVATPEPATLTIWSLGALGCAIATYRRRRLVA